MISEYKNIKNRLTKTIEQTQQHSFEHEMLSSQYLHWQELPERQTT
jgi:hypothetical protein